MGREPGVLDSGILVNTARAILSRCASMLDSILESDNRGEIDRNEVLRRLVKAEVLLDFIPDLSNVTGVEKAKVKDKSVLEEIGRIRSVIEEAEQDVRHEEADLVRMNTLGTMVPGLAHEINQPLQVILSVAQNCAHEIQRDIIDREGILADLGKVTVNIERINRIVNHLLMLAKDREPKLELVDVNTVIENSFIMFYRQLTESRGIKIIKNLSEKLPSVKADSIQLEQVFINLINNARDALDGCKDRTVGVSTKKQGGHILVEFRDSGKGVAAEDLPRIFDAFFTTKEEGMGLGLHIVQDIVQSYGGTITASSEIDKGTTFLIKLPVAEEEMK